MNLHRPAALDAGKCGNASLPSLLSCYSSPVFARRTDWNLAPNALSLALDRFRRSGRPILDLTESNPTHCLDYSAVQSAILRALADPAALSYSPDPRGLLSAREAVASYYAARGARVAPADLILTTSTSEAYSFLFRLLCDPGDEMLVPAPSYPLFEFLADLQDVRLVPYALVYDHGWQIDFHSLEHALTPRSRAVVLVHPNNPTGSYLKPAEREQLHALAAARHLALIVDEVFLDYPLTAHGLDRTFAGRDGALTFTLSGLSKIAALPQMKVAWIAAGGAGKADALARLEVIADTYLSMNAPLQHALPTLLDVRHAAREQLSAHIDRNLAALDAALPAAPHLARLEIEGGWYAVLRVPVTRTDEELAIALLQSEGVYVHPGHFYNFHADGYLVLSLITPPGIFAAGLARLLAFLAS